MRCTRRYILYLDGTLAGQVPLPAGNDSAQIDGGQPLDLGQADIFLCARADENSTRFFSGSLAHLGVWDVALQADEVRELLVVLFLLLVCLPQLSPGAAAFAWPDMDCLPLQTAPPGLTGCGWGCGHHACEGHLLP